jgi:hypothetical protein
VVRAQLGAQPARRVESEQAPWRGSGARGPAGGEVPVSAEDERRRAAALAETEALAAAEQRCAPASRRRGTRRRVADALSKLRAEEARRSSVLARRQRLEKEQRSCSNSTSRSRQAIGEARGQALAAAIETMEATRSDREARWRSARRCAQALDAARAEAHRSPRCGAPGRPETPVAAHAERNDPRCAGAQPRAGDTLTSACSELEQAHRRQRQRRWTRCASTSRSSSP